MRVSLPATLRIQRSNVTQLSTRSYALGQACPAPWADAQGGQSCRDTRGRGLSSTTEASSEDVRVCSQRQPCLLPPERSSREFGPGQRPN